jgi:hypothetical protein
MARHSSPVAVRMEGRRKAGVMTVRYAANAKDARQELQSDDGRKVCGATLCLCPKSCKGKTVDREVPGDALLV